MYITYGKVFGGTPNFVTIDFIFTYPILLTFSISISFARFGLFHLSDSTEYTPGGGGGGH